MGKIFFFVSFMFVFTVPVNAQQKSITFGIVPQQSAKILAAQWTPIFEYLSQQTGLNITFSTAKDIPTFEKRLESGEYDVAYMNPYHYITFSDSGGYDAIAKQQDKTIMGVIVVRKDSKVKRIEDLQGMQLAFPAPAAFASTILPQAELKKLNISFNPVYVSSHDSVYLNVSRDFFIAGGGINRTLNNMPEDILSTLTTIWESEKYTSHAIAIHPRLDSLLRQKLLASLLSMNNSEQGKVLLNNINFKGFEKAVNEDWDDVRTLNIETPVAIESVN